ncbi:hypothetical protein BASA81_014432 [Batrachochytrium salamandrivorans]|nr:hypothetical protein BASA81_014432 [Batrachochytrium salamandrivorans]
MENSEHVKIATVGTLLSGRALIWYIPMVEYPLAISYILSSWEGFKKGHDQYVWYSPIRLKNPSPRFVFWVKAPNHALRTLPHSAKLATDLE